MHDEIVTKLEKVQDDLKNATRLSKTHKEELACVIAEALQLLKAEDSAAAPVDAQLPSAFG